MSPHEFSPVTTYSTIFYKLLTTSSEIVNAIRNMKMMKGRHEWLIVCLFDTFCITYSYINLARPHSKGFPMCNCIDLYMNNIVDFE